MNHKIVYAFVAFDDIELLERKIKFLYTEEDYFIVHWNKYSSRAKLRQLQRAFKDSPNVHIYSKIKVVWGTNSILLAMLENMQKALCLASAGEGQFKHLIMLSEQCIPVKSKEYIKQHLCGYRGKSFCGSFHIIPERANVIDSFALTKYAFLASYPGCFPFFVHLRVWVNLIIDFFYNFISILKNSKQTLQTIKQSKSFQTMRKASGAKKIFLRMKFIVLFPLQFVFSSLNRGRYIGMYGKSSQLLPLCTSGTFQKTKSSGPTGCYCWEDVEFLCQPENIKLAKSMKRYFGPEEYFCQTLLYNSTTQRKNFLDENLCATDYYMQGIRDVLCYLDPQAGRKLGEEWQNYQFKHVCFLRKVTDSKVWDLVETSLDWGDKEKQIQS